MTTRTFNRGGLEVTETSWTIGDVKIAVQTSDLGIDVIEAGCRSNLDTIRRADHIVWMATSKAEAGRIAGWRIGIARAVLADETAEMVA